MPQVPEEVRETVSGACDWKVPRCAATAYLTTREGLECAPRPVVQIKAMTEDDMAHWWNLYIDKLTGLLAAADARPQGPLPDTARRIQALQREALFLHIRCVLARCRAPMILARVIWPPQGACTREPSLGGHEECSCLGLRVDGEYGTA